MSLKVALEQLLGGPCYHMMEVFGKPDVAETWKRAVEGDFPDWDEFLARLPRRPSTGPRPRSGAS